MKLQSTRDPMRCKRKFKWKNVLNDRGECATREYKYSNGMEKRHKVIVPAQLGNSYSRISSRQRAYSQRVNSVFSLSTFEPRTSTLRFSLRASPFRVNVLSLSHANFHLLFGFLVPPSSLSFISLLSHREKKIGQFR